MIESIDKYEYIWNKRKDDYILIKTEFGYAIVDKLEKSMFLISDKKLEEMVIDRMLKYGNKIYENIDQAFRE